MTPAARHVQPGRPAASQAVRLRHRAGGDPGRGLPLTWYAYPGDRPDVTQFPDMIDQLKSQYEQVCAAGRPAEAADMTVVFDAGQNSEANFAHFAKTGLHYIGSVPASDCPDLTALPASKRTLVDEGRFGGLTAYDTRRTVYGAERRVPSAPATTALQNPPLSCFPCSLSSIRPHHPRRSQGRDRLQRLTTPR